jgi:hypothetical protein
LKYFGKFHYFRVSLENQNPISYFPPCFTCKFEGCFSMCTSMCVLAFPNLTFLANKYQEPNSQPDH